MMYKLTYDKAVLETDALTTAEAMVALAWASVCNYKNGSDVRQSFDSVATKAKMSRRNVIRITQALVTKGWLQEVERTPYKPTVYRLTIPSDTTSLVTDEPEVVTNETPTSDTTSLALVTNGTPTSDTMSPNKNNNKKIDKNKDKNKNKSAATPAPGLQEVDHHPLDISTSGAVPLESSPEAVAPPITEDEEMKEALRVLNEQPEWDIENPEGSEKNAPSKETGETVEAVREKSGPVLDPSQVASEVAKRAEGKGSLRSWQKETVVQAQKMLDEGFEGTWDELISKAQKAVEW